MQAAHHPLGQEPIQRPPRPLGLGLLEELQAAPARPPTHSSLLPLLGGLQPLGSSSPPPQALAQPTQQVSTSEHIYLALKHCA